MSGRLTIAHLCTSRAFGGLELNVALLSERLARRGHRSIVFCPDDSPLAVKVRDASGEVIPIDPKRKYVDFHAIRLLRNELHRYRADVLIAHPSHDVNLAVLARKRSLATRIFYYQHMQVGMKKRSFRHTYLYRKLDGWIAPSEYLRTNTLALTRVDAAKISVIPLGIDLDRFNPARIDREAARLRFGLPRDAFVAGVVGRIDFGKGQKHLIEATALLRQRGIDLFAFIVGEATKNESNVYAAELRQLARELGVEDRVVFHPFIDDIEQAYAAMDLFCLTSLSETYGMVTLEAMAMQRPVIATDSAGTPALVAHEVNGILVPPQQSHALADAIQRLSSAPQLAAQLATQANRAVHERYSYHRQCEMLEALFAKYQ